jgi:hypothetical protein
LGELGGGDGGGEAGGLVVDECEHIAGTNALAFLDGHGFHETVAAGGEADEAALDIDAALGVDESGRSGNSRGGSGGCRSRTADKGERESKGEKRN